MEKIDSIVQDRATDLLDAALDRCRRLALERGPGVVWQKQSGTIFAEPVTELDRDIEEHLIRVIESEYPDAAIVAEESSACPELLGYPMCFVIDPIDGTKELLSGGDGFCVSVALLSNRKPVFGVLDFPARRQRFWAYRGRGARMNGSDFKVPPAAGTPRLAAVSPAQAAEPRFEGIRAKLPAIRLEPFGGLSSKLVSVACGHFDAAFFLGWDGYRALVWDYAASGLVLEEAGGRFTSLDGVSILDVMSAVHSGGWLASHGSHHERMLALMMAANLSSGTV